MASTTPLRPLTPIRIPLGPHAIHGDLGWPGEADEARGLVLFAHGSGSSRHSPRNQFVARALERDQFATLLIDLLTEAEEVIDLRTAELRFDIMLLATRLIEVIDWARTQPQIAPLPIGLFGASTGAAAALVAAAERPHDVAAVVSRGGRPDLAADFLARVTAPVLLIVGGHDEPVIRLNRTAASRLPGGAQIEIVAGATHLFEEPGALARVAELASRWFVTHLASTHVDRMPARRS